MSNNKPKQIYNRSTHNHIFNEDGAKYVIPLYQRAFAWTDKEIVQLIEDINEATGRYYLGSLIVYKRDNGSYEVIDGQQRLTALFLLLDYLFDYCKYSNLDASVLTFECRPTAIITLEKITKCAGLDNIREEIKKNENELQLDVGLYNGAKIIEETFAKEGIDPKEFLETKLSNVLLYRIEVPPHTDLNRYFEIMNTRGEQLEQADILKATLMNYIKDDDKIAKERFAQYWNACADMDGYVQMHFESNLRKIIFVFNRKNPIKYDKEIFKESKTAATCSIVDVLKKDIPVKMQPYDEDEDNTRFEGIISFPYFLLHVLGVYLNKTNIPLDDKKLLQTFNTELDLLDSAEKEKFSNNFIRCLLKCRFLFDKYLIKREYIGDNVDGKWSLKTLEARNGKPYYANTKFNFSGEWEKNYERRHKRILMLQSCMRVSYTSPKAMRWITETLSWLYYDKHRDDMSKFEKVLEKLATQPVDEYLKNGEYNEGTLTPHIVFNYLDYLLWKDATDKDKDKYKDFTFEYRTSVEHWYPQHPSEGTFTEMKSDEGLNHFGNLCLLQRNINSKFSNLAPSAKKTTFCKAIAKGSLKLRLMSELMEKLSDEQWRTEGYKIHGEEMLQKLKIAVDELKSEN